MKKRLLIVGFVLLPMVYACCKKDRDNGQSGNNQNTANWFLAGNPQDAALHNGMWHVPNNLPIEQQATALVSNSFVWNNSAMVHISSAGGAGAGSLQLKAYEGGTWVFKADGNYILTKSTNDELYGLQTKTINTQKEIRVAQLDKSGMTWKTISRDTMALDSFRYAYIMAQGNDLYRLQSIGASSSADHWKLRLLKWNGASWNTINSDVLASYAPYVPGSNVEMYDFGTKHVVRLSLYNPNNRDTYYIFFELSNGGLKEIFSYTQQDPLNIQLGRVLWANNQFYYAALDQLYTITNGQLNSMAKAGKDNAWYWSDSDGETLFFWTANSGSGSHIDIMNKEKKWTKVPVKLDYTNTQHKFSMGRLHWLYKHMSFFEWNNQYVFAGTSDYSNVDYSIAAFYKR